MLILLGVLSFLLSQYSPNSFKPHLKLISIHICNGMTHLRKDIRSHSLEFIDLFNSRIPSLMKEYSFEFIPNYLQNQIIIQIII